MAMGASVRELCRHVVMEQAKLAVFRVMLELLLERAVVTCL